MSAKLHRQIRKTILVLKRSEDAEEYPNKMTPGERNVFLCLAQVAHDDGTSIYCGVDFIRENTSLSRFWVQKCLRKLEYKGYIVPVANAKGGRGRPTMYHIPLDQFGVITPIPILKEEAEPFLDDTDTDQAPPVAAPPVRSRRPAATIPETPVPTPGNLPVVLGSQALVALEIGTDLHEIGKMYIGLIELQACEVAEEGGKRFRTKKWDDYQPLLRRARDGYNEALEIAGIQASDGHKPPIDDELEQQLQDWAARAYIHKGWRDLFEIGSEKWNRWNDKTEQDMETFGSLLYHIQKLEVETGGIPVI